MESSSESPIAQSSGAHEPDLEREVGAPRRPRIAICLSHFYPTIGGAEGQLLSLAERWALGGHEPLVFTRSLAGAADREIHQGVEIRRVLKPRSLGPLFGASFVAGLAGQLIRNRRRFDAIVAGQSPWEAVAVGLVARRLGKPSVARIASTGPLGDLAQLRRAKGSFFLRRAFLGVERFLAPSRQAAKELAEIGVPEARVIRLANGVDCRKFSPPANESESRSRTVLFVGRLAPAKNPLAVLRAWRHVDPALEARLLIAGDGPLDAEMRTYAKEESLARVEFLGECSDMVEVYRQASILVQTSPSEGCSNAVLEGMACEACPIASNVSGNQDTIREGETGKLVPLDDDLALARAIGESLRDPQGRKRLAAAARRHVLEFHDLDRVAAEYVRLLEHGDRHVA